MAKRNFNSSKATDSFHIFQMQKRLLQKEENNKFPMSRVRGVQNSRNKTYLMADV